MQPSDFAKDDFRLETERLVIRKFRPDDAPDMFGYASDPRTSEFLLWSPHPSLKYTREIIGYMIRDFETGKFFDLALELKANGKMIGTACVTSFDNKHRTAELGYVISPEYWRKGIATEALEAMLNFVFCELEVHRAECKYMVGNEISRRVMEKCGMTFEGIERGRMLVKGIYRDIGCCSILENEYFSVPRKSVYRASRESVAPRKLFRFRHK